MHIYTKAYLHNSLTTLSRALKHIYTPVHTQMHSYTPTCPFIDTQMHIHTFSHASHAVLYKCTHLCLHAHVLTHT